jgi:hypothetical protein
MNRVGLVIGWLVRWAFSLVTFQPVIAISCVSLSISLHSRLEQSGLELPGGVLSLRINIEIMISGRCSRARVCLLLVLCCVCVPACMRMCVYVFVNVNLRDCTVLLHKGIALVNEFQILQRTLNDCSAAIVCIDYTYIKHVYILFSLSSHLTSISYFFLICVFLRVKE